MMADLIGADDFRRRLDAITQPRQILGTIATQAVAEAKHLVPRKTGNLARTIRLQRVTDSDASIIAGGRGGVGYARAVEFGTGPRIITTNPPGRRARKSRRPGSLAWGGSRALSGRLRKGASPDMFRRIVHHPGTRAQPYLVPGVRTALDKAGVDVLIRAWNEAV